MKVIDMMFGSTAILDPGIVHVNEFIVQCFDDGGIPHIENTRTKDIRIACFTGKISGPDFLDFIVPERYIACLQCQESIGLKALYMNILNDHLLFTGITDCQCTLWSSVVGIFSAVNHSPFSRTPG